MLTVGKHILKHWEKSRKEAGLTEVYKVIRGMSAFCCAKPGQGTMEETNSMDISIYQVSFLFSSQIIETQGGAESCFPSFLFLSFS